MPFFESLKALIRYAVLSHRGSRSRWRLVLSALWLIGIMIGLSRITVQAAPKPTLTPTQTAVPETGTALITTPGDGAEIFGVTAILGTATSASLQNYQLQWLASADPRAQWQLIAGPITQQVNGGTLGQWDTTKVADGTYQIRLRLTLRDNTTVDAYVSRITVSNQQATPIPAAISVTATVIPTLGPSPTPLIQQPPTATPNATFQALVASSTNNTSQFGIDIGSVPVAQAAISGVGLTIVGFAVGTGYTILRTQRRKRRKQRGFMR